MPWSSSARLLTASGSSSWSGRVTPWLAERQYDACDPDKDNDGVLNAADNCELRVNAGQESTNSYGVGDACVPIPITVPWLGVTTQPLGLGGSSGWRRG